MYLTEIIPGITLTLLGLSSFLHPQFASLTANWALACLFFISGPITLFKILNSSERYRKALAFISILILISTGIAMIYFPEVVSLSLSLVIILYLIIVGILRLYPGYYCQYLSSRAWLIASGLLMILFPLTTIIFLPETVSWLIGSLVGVYLIYSGMCYLLLSN